MLLQRLVPLVGEVFFYLKEICSRLCSDHSLHGCSWDGGLAGPAQHMENSAQKSEASYLFYLDLPLIDQLPNHAGHRHHPGQHHDQGEKEANVVQESVRAGGSQHPQPAKPSSHSRSGGALSLGSFL